MTRAVKFLKPIGKSVLLQVTFLIGAYSARANEQFDPERLRASLSARLEAAATAADSIPLIYDIHDLTPENDCLPCTRRMFEVARRAGNQDVQLDMLRQWARIGARKGNDSVVAEALELVDEMPSSENQRQTRTFILASKSSTQRFESDSDRSAYLRQLMKKYLDAPDDIDPYERIDLLFAITTLLSAETQGELLSEYLDYLDKAITALPKLPNNFLRSKFNAIAAPAYAHNDEIAKSIKADRSQLLNICQLQKLYRSAGRFYKNFDANRYASLRRMLLNYEHLTDKELSDYHSQVLEIVERNPEIAADYQNDPSAGIGMLVHQGKLDKAIAAAKRAAADASNLYDRRRTMRQLIDIAEKAGDTLLQLSTENRNYYVLEEYVKHKANERVRELQILYDVNAMRRHSASARLQRDRAKLVTLYCAVALLVLLLTASIAVGLRYRKRGKTLIVEKSALRAEIDELKHVREELRVMTEKARDAETEKVQLISYMSRELSAPLNAIVNYSQMVVENAREESKEFMRHFASVIEMNSRILQSVANDIQDFSMIDSKQVQLHRVPVDANIIAEMPVESIKPQLAENVSIEFTPLPGADNFITTDPRRLQIVLLSALANVARVTLSGKIDVSIKFDSDNGTCSYIITANGETLSHREELKEMFGNNWDRFVPDTSIAGLNLPNCRMILDALGGTLVQDEENPDLLRLVLTIPIN